MTETPTQPTDQTDQIPPADNTPSASITLKGRFARYTSSFWDLVVTLLPIRYFWEAVEDINPKNFLSKPEPNVPKKTQWAAPNLKKYMSYNFAAHGAGATVLTAIGYYSKCTYDDIKNLFSEAVGYELNKKPEDVNWHDLFFKSKNEALRTTCNAYLKRSIARFAAGGSFLIPWHIFRDWKHGPPKFDANIKAGVAGMALELAWEGLGREESLFDREQNIVGTALSNHSNSIHRLITSDDVKAMLLLRRQDTNKDYRFPSLATEAGQQEDRLAKRIADLINQTYHNAPKTCEAHFTVGKLNYLIGFNLLDDPNTSLAFVELANRSHDMREVKEAAASLQSGKTSPHLQSALDNGDNNRITDTATTCFTKTIAHAGHKPPQAAPRSHMHFATEQDNALLLNR